VEPAGPDAYSRPIPTPVPAMNDLHLLMFLGVLVFSMTTAVVAVLADS
jgi:hypothetical protein